ncbi:putative tetratricopeptide-like helical domain superfamily [Helianthus annuus]|nr:putative tetratricopeptide-like helical domain superfamily [Helianthus annuus]KAJ0607260.1 putative tetratricopeptide-like helical domain superfamily [Helianthus annuus]KAJ0767320.1 putative tetratricopeptide-like helical domain superfamily [Helianthus annuus]
MIIKSPKPLLSSTIHLISHVASLSCTNYIQSTDQNPLNSTQYEAKIQSLRNKLHPETLINILSSTSDLNSSLRLFKWASLQHHFQHTTDTYYHMIMKLGMASRVDEVEGFCNEMVKAGFSASEQALLRLIDGFVINHKLDEALRVFSVLSLNGYKPSVSLVNRVLGVLVEEKKGIKDVLFVYKEMAKADICPNTETLNWVMQALFDDDWVDSALDQYKRMEKKGCCANSRTYEIVVSGLIGKNRLDQALVVLSDVFESGCVFELEFFSCVLPLLFEMGEYDMGLRLFGKMKSLNVVPDLSVYEVLIWCFAKNQCTDDAMDLVNDMEMVEKNITNSLSWNILVSYLSENQRYDTVYKALTRMIVSGNPLDSTTYTALIIGRCKSNKVHDALDLFHHIREEQWIVDSSCYDTLIESLCQTNKIQDAVDVFHHGLFNKCIVRTSTFSMLIKGLCLNAKVNKVVDFLHLASHHGLSCSSEDYSIIMKSMYTLSKSNDLLTIVGRMVVEGCPLSSKTYNHIIKSMSDHQRSTECALYLNQMVNKGLLPDTEILSGSLSFLAQKLQLHTVLPAIHKLLSVSDHCVLNHAICNVIINGLWKEGYKQEARLVLDVILENGWVPDSTTHRLLISSGSSEADEKGGDTEDEISNILSEGFGEP